MHKKIKRRVCLFLIALLAFTTIPYGAFSERAEAATGQSYNLQLEGTQNYTACQELMTYVNQARTAAGVPTLILDKELTDVAMQRAAEIAYYFAHTRPNRTKSQTACASGRMWGENIAAGNSTAYATHLQWMNSPAHKQSLLMASHRGIGLGHFYHNGIHYWVQVFSSSVGYVETRTGTVDAIRNFEIIEDQYPLRFSGYSSKVSLDYGESTRLQVTARNQGWTSYSALFRRYCFNWSSSNPNVVSVNTEGDIKGLAVGTATITAKTKIGNGSISIPVTVTKDFSDAVVSQPPDVTYTGSAIHPSMTVTYKGTNLVEGKDYTVSYGENINTGSGTVTITGKGDFTGSQKKSFLIQQMDIEKEAVISLSSWDYGNEAMVDYLSNHLSVTYNGKRLVKDQDYLIAYTNARTDLKKITEYAIQFIGNYTGYRRGKCLDPVQFRGLNNQLYTGNPLTPTFTASLKPNIYSAYVYNLVEGVDYRVEYSNNINVGQATIQLLPLGDNYGKAETTFQISHPPYNVTFDGNKGICKEKTRSISYGSSYGNLPTATRKGYTFSGWYTSKTGGKKVTATSTYQTAGNQTLYARWKKVSVDTASIKSVKKLPGKKLKVTVKKNSSVKGYQVVIATNKSFTKNKKTLTGTSTIKTFKNLKKTKYYVKVRAYKYDSAGMKVYGKYSKVKTIKIK